MQDPAHAVTVVIEGAHAFWTVVTAASAVTAAIATCCIAVLTRRLREVAERTAGLQESHLLHETRPALTMRAADPPWDAPPGDIATHNERYGNLPLYQKFAGVDVVNAGRGVAVLDSFAYDGHEVPLDKAELAPSVGVHYPLRDGVAEIIRKRYGEEKRLPDGKTDSISFAIVYHEPIRCRRFRQHFRLNIHNMTVVPLHCEDLDERSTV